MNEREFLKSQWRWLFPVSLAGAAVVWFGVLGALMWALNYGGVLDTAAAWTVWKWLAGLVVLLTLLRYWKGERMAKRMALQEIDEGEF